MGVSSAFRFLEADCKARQEAHRKRHGTCLGRRGRDDVSWRDKGAGRCQCIGIKAATPAPLPSAQDTHDPTPTLLRTGPMSSPDAPTLHAYRRGRGRGLQEGQHAIHFLLLHVHDQQPRHRRHEPCAHVKGPEKLKPPNSFPHALSTWECRSRGSGCTATGGMRQKARPRNGADEPVKCSELLDPSLSFRPGAGRGGSGHRGVQRSSAAQSAPGSWPCPALATKVTTPKTKEWAPTSSSSSDHTKPPSLCQLASDAGLPQV